MDMDSQRWQRIKEIFEEVRQTPHAQRDERLAAACADDGALRRELERLLVRDGPPSALDDPSAAIGLPRSEPQDWAAKQDAPAPSTVGRYGITGVVGVGAHGIVYRAVDEDGTRVALKVLRSAAPNRDLRRRFEYEAQAIRQLDHPCVARIHDAGATSNAAGVITPHIAMELVEGTTITEYAGAHGLAQRQVVELFLRVCDGVAHAHQRGVIHRDLKPGNVLVTTGGDPKILDFGLAKFITPEGSSTGTIDGQLLGTPSYMSPEQASGQPERIDTRSDVYSLGAILYELLGGRPPLAVASLGMLDAVRTVEQMEPVRLGSIAPGCRGDLETIVAKALEKDPARRYQTAAELGSDLRRFLAQEPVLARPASLGYVLMKFARRHRPLVAAIGLAGAALLAAGVVVLKEQHDAVRSHQTASELASVLLTRVIGPSWDRIGTVEERRALLFEIRDRVEQFVSRYPDDATMQLDYARLLARLTDQAESDSDAPSMLRYARRALAIYERLSAAQPDDLERLADLSTAVVRVGDALARTGLRDEQDACYLRAHAIDLELHRRWPENAGLARMLAFSHERQSARAKERGDMRSAVTHAEAELSLAEQLASATPGDPGSEWLLASALGLNASLWQDAGELGRAEALQRRCMAAFDALCAAAPGSRRYVVGAISVRLSLADLVNPGSPRGSELMREIDERLSPLMAQDPTDNVVRELRSAYCAARMRAAGAAGDAAELEEALRMAEQTERALTAGDPDGMEAVRRFGKIYAVCAESSIGIGARGLHDRCASEAVRLMELLFAEKNADAHQLHAYAWLALVVTDTPSETLIDRGEEAIERCAGLGLPPGARLELARAVVHHARGRGTEADAALRRAEELLGQCPDDIAERRMREFREAWAK